MVIVVIVSIDIVIDVDDQGDDGGNKAHVAEGIGSARHPVTSQILTLLGFLLELVYSLRGDIIGPGERKS